MKKNLFKKWFYTKIKVPEPELIPLYLNTNSKIRNFENVVKRKM